VPEDVLELVGRRLRDARAERGWTIRELAERSGVSVRFLVQLEAGRGNISVRRLAELAGAFALSPADLLTEPSRHTPRLRARTINWVSCTIDRDDDRMRSPPMNARSAKRLVTIVWS